MVEADGDRLYEPLKALPANQQRNQSQDYSTGKSCKVIGEGGIIRDKPGFEVDLVTRASATEDMHQHDRPSVLMPVKGHWTVTWGGGQCTLAPGDTMSVPEGTNHTILPSMTGEAALYQITGTNDPAGLTWQG